jgi:hypothetical protein
MRWRPREGPCTAVVWDARAALSVGFAPEVTGAEADQAGRPLVTAW